MTRAPRGFTLIETMVVVAIVGVLTGMTAVGLSRAVNAARVSGNRASLVSALDFARSRANATGRDAYVVFGNVDEKVLFPDPKAPFVLVYDDTTGTLRSSLDDIMTAVNANPVGVRERFQASDGSSIFFRSGIHDDAVPACDPSDLPAYMAVTRTERQSACSPAFCSFCEEQNGACIGAIRFGPDGTARVVTGPAVGSGAMIRLVARNDTSQVVAGSSQTACVAVSEPSGIAMTVKE